MPLGLDSILLDLDNTDIDLEEIEHFIQGLPALDTPAANGGPRSKRKAFGRANREKAWLFNTAWIALCLVILTGSSLFAWYMLTK